MVTRHSLVVNEGGFETVTLGVPEPVNAILSVDTVPELVHVGIEIGPNVTDDEVHVSEPDKLV